MNILIMIFCVSGIMFFSMFIHEGFHIIEAKEPVSVCYDFGQKTIAHVTAKDFKTNGEFLAYYFQILFIAACSLYYIKKEKEIMEAL